MASMTPRPKRGARLHEPDPQAIAGQAARHEHDVAVGAADAFASEGEVVDRHGQNLAAFRSRHGSDTISVAYDLSQFAARRAFKRGEWHTRLKYHGPTMRSGRSSFPLRVADLLTAAVPALEERLLELTHPPGLARRGRRRAGPRTRPGDLRAGTLEVRVDNSPWLQELSMRSAEVARGAPRPLRHRPSPRCAQPRGARAGALHRRPPAAPPPAPPLRLDADELAAGGRGGRPDARRGARLHRPRASWPRA